jgi:hypothetical protein
VSAPAKAQSCELCRVRRGEQMTWYSPEEWTALIGRTGWEGERAGRWDAAKREPVITALLLPRCGIRHFAGMPRPMLVDWEQPAFACPWSPNIVPPILGHGPAYRTADGTVRCEFKLDECGCLHKTSHCKAFRTADGSAGSYYIRPFTDPDLPRVRVPDLVVR